DLDVARVLEVSLDVDGRVREVRLALAPGRLERPLDLVRGADDLEPLAAAPGGGLDCKGPAKLVAEPPDLLRGGDRLGRPWDDRDAGPPHRLPGRDLRAHQLDRFGR